MFLLLTRYHYWSDNIMSHIYIYIYNMSHTYIYIYIQYIYIHILSECVYMNIDVY